MKQIEGFLKHWPHTAALMLLGALIGFIAWMYLPRQYVAVSHFSVSIDYNRTGTLDHLEEDRLLGITEDVLHSDRVMQAVFERSSEDDYREFFAKTRTTRTNETWALSIVGKDPEEITELALFWMVHAYDLLSDELRHAYLAEVYENQLDGLTGCIQNTSAAVYPAGCPEDPQTVMDAIASLSAQVEYEKAAANGLSSAVLLGGKNPGQMELREASRSAAFDTLAGAFCGFLLSFAFVWLPGDGKRQ